MTRSALLPALTAGLCLVGFGALAQESGGRTDGAEGSEYGKGGYERVGGGQFSLELNWGAAVTDQPALSGRPGAPITLGLTAGWWAADWAVLEVTGAYLFSNGQVDALVGPRFRTAYLPISLSVGLKAGLMSTARDPALFGISPQVGADILIRRKVLLGLNYALDIPIGAGFNSSRVYLNVGYRF